MNFYVYYKVSPGQLAKLRPQVQDLFRQIREQFGVQGRWMHRRDDASTYMEVYEGVKQDEETLAAFSALLEREGGRLGTQFSLARKVERFISAETPA